MKDVEQAVVVVVEERRAAPGSFDDELLEVGRRRSGMDA